MTKILDLRRGGYQTPRTTANKPKQMYFSQSRTVIKRIPILSDEFDVVVLGGGPASVTAALRARQSQRHLLVYGLNEHYQQLFELTRLNEAFGIFEDEAEALEAVSALRV